MHGVNFKVYEQSGKAEATKYNAIRCICLGGFKGFFKLKMLLDHSDTCSLPRGDAAHRNCASAAPVHNVPVVVSPAAPVCGHNQLPAVVYPLETSDFNCFPHFNQLSLAKSVSQAFPTQTHQSLFAATPDLT